MFIALLFFSHSPCLARADIIVLDYIVKGKLISKLEENERVSLIFSTNRKSVTREEVSNDYNNFNPWLKHIKECRYYRCLDQELSPVFYNRGEHGQ